MNAFLPFLLKRFLSIFFSMLSRSEVIGSSHLFFFFPSLFGFVPKVGFPTVFDCCAFRFVSYCLLILSEYFTRLFLNVFSSSLLNSSCCCLCFSVCSLNFSSFPNRSSSTLSSFSSPESFSISLSVSTSVRTCDFLVSLCS